MKRVKALLAASLLIGAVMLSGCGEDCNQEDQNRCAAAFSTCTAGCGVDSACAENCSTTFKKCLKDAGCESNED